MVALPPLPKAVMEAVGAGGVVGAGLAQGGALASPHLPQPCRAEGRAAAACHLLH